MTVEQKDKKITSLPADKKPVRKNVVSVNNIVRKTGNTAKKPASKRVRTLRAKLLISIVNQKDGVHLKEILDEVSVAMSYTFAGTGTARSAVLDYLGIGETEKAVVCSLIPESDELTIMRAIREKMSLYLVGRGISFTVPLTGISEIVANGIISAATNKQIDWSGIMRREERKYDLIVAAMAANCVDDAMEAARAAGAAGGTVIRSRALKNDKAEQFIGISLMQEQEILLILTKCEGKLAIMQALSDKIGLKTEAGGVIFSLPVDRTAGISATDEADTAAEEENK